MQKSVGGSNHPLGSLKFDIFPVDLSHVYSIVGRGPNSITKLDEGMAGLFPFLHVDPPLGKCKDSLRETIFSRFVSNARICVNEKLFQN